MSVSRIRREEFEAVGRPERKGRRAAETIALVGLPMDAGIKMPCRWQHDKHGACPGRLLLMHVGYRHGFHVGGVCSGAILYVWKSKAQERLE